MVTCKLKCERCQKLIELIGIRFAKRIFRDREDETLKATNFRECATLTTKEGNKITSVRKVIGYCANCEVIYYFKPEVKFLLQLDSKQHNDNTTY